MSRLAPYHARRRIVSEMRVVLKTEGLIESHRRSEIANGQIHEDHSGHWRILLVVQIGSFNALPSVSRTGTSDFDRTLRFSLGNGTSHHQIQFRQHGPDQFRTASNHITTWRLARWE